MPSIQTISADLTITQNATDNIILTSTGDWTVAGIHDLAAKLSSLLNKIQKNTVVVSPKKVKNNNSS